MDLSAYIDVPILMIVYIGMEAIKRTILNTDKTKKYRAFIPVMAPIIGSIISIFIFYNWPYISTSVNALNAFASGAISGAAATGGNQIYKQISKFFSTDDSNCDCDCCN